MIESITFSGPVASRPSIGYMSGFRDTNTHTFYATDEKKLYTWNRVDKVWDSPTAATQYVHVQSVGSNQWIVNHNLGYRPAAVEVLSPGGYSIIAEIAHISVNQLRVYFATLSTGSVVVS